MGPAGVNCAPVAGLMTVLTALVASGCTELPPAPEPAEARRLLFAAGCERIPACRTCTLSVSALDRNGQPTLVPALEWSSSDVLAATVSGGTVTGIRSSPVTITAMVAADHSVSAEKDITIVPGSPACPTGAGAPGAITET